MGSFLIWDKNTREIVDCIPHPSGSTITLDAMFSHREPDYLEKYDGKDIEPTVVKTEFIDIYVLTEELNVVTKDSLKTESDILQEEKQKKRAQIASERYNQEVGGLNINGSVIKTDRESQATLTSAWVRVQQVPDLLIDWKSNNGWVQIGKAEIEAICSAVGTHVQNCFTRERQLNQLIEAATTAVELHEIQWN